MKILPIHVSVPVKDAALALTKKRGHTTAEQLATDYEDALTVLLSAMPSITEQFCAIFAPGQRLVQHGYFDPEDN